MTDSGEDRDTAVIEARDLCKSFGQGAAETPILKHVDVRISPGEFVVLIGPSGSGKSTLLSILGLLEPPSSGRLFVDQQDVSGLSRRQLARLRGRKLGYVFQSFNLLAGLSVAENVMLSGLLVGESGRAQYERAVELLDEFGLADKARRVPAELSGGEQQRVAIARAIVKRPEVLLCDEPTGALDYETGKLVLEVIERINRELGTTVVVITHNAAIARMADRVIRLGDGRIQGIERNPTRLSPSELSW